MKKMKFITKGLVLLMMGAMLAGCSNAADDSVEESKREAASKEAAMSVDSSSSSEEKQTTVEENAGESVSQQAVVDDKEPATDSSEADAKPSLENPETELKNPDGGTQVSNGEYADLEKEYNEYFKNVQMDGKQFVFDMDMSSYGMEVTLSMRFGAKDGASFIYIGLPNKNSKEENGFEMYVMKDSTAYLRMAIAGQDPAIYKTEHLSEENASSLNFAEGLVDIDQKERDVQLTYVRQETVNGVKYDVLKFEDDYYVYMNAQSKEWEMMKVIQDGQEYMIYVKSFDGVTLPDGYKTAEVIGEEEFASNMMMGLMALLVSTGDYNLD